MESLGINEILYLLLVALVFALLGIIWLTQPGGRE